MRDSNFHRNIFIVLFSLMLPSCAHQYNATRFDHYINQELKLKRSVMIYERGRGDPGFIFNAKELKRGELYQLGEKHPSHDDLPYDKYLLSKGSPLRITKVLKYRAKSWWETKVYGEIFVEEINDWVDFQYRESDLEDEPIAPWE